MTRTLVPVLLVGLGIAASVVDAARAESPTLIHATVIGCGLAAIVCWLLWPDRTSLSATGSVAAQKSVADQQQELEELQSQIESTLEERARELDAREVTLNNRLVTFQEWLEYPQPVSIGGEPTDPGRSADLSDKDQQVLDLLQREAEQLYERLKTGHYTKNGRPDTELARDDAVDLMIRVAKIYQPESDMPLLETSVSQLLRAGSRACLHLLIVLERLPLNLEESDLVTLHSYAQKAVKAWDLYQAAEPWFGHARKALYAGRIASGASPMTMGLTWALTELGKRGAKAAAKRFVDQQAIAVLHDVVRVVGFEVASVFGGDFRHRDPNWIYAAELTDLMSRFPVSRESLAHAMREIGSLPMRNEYDRIFLYRCLSTHKAAYPLVDNLELTTSEQRQDIARKLERFFRNFVHGRTRKRVDSWLEDVESRLGVRLALGEAERGGEPATSASGEDSPQWKAAESLAGFLVGAKGHSPADLAERLGNFTTVATLPDDERTRFLDGIADDAPQFFEVPDVDVDSKILDNFFADLIRASVETPPIDLQPDDLVFESATYFGRDVRKTREQLDRVCIEFATSSFAASAPTQKIAASTARLILMELPTDQTARFCYEDLAVNSGPDSMKEGKALLVGTDTHLFLLHEAHGRGLFAETGSLTAARIDGMVIDDCHLSGTDWQWTGSDSRHSIDLTLKGAVVTRYDNWFRPLLESITAK